MQGLLDINSHVCLSGVKDYISNCIFNSELELWRQKVNSVHGNRPGTRNKLRSYCLYKCNLNTECYVMSVTNRGDRRALAQFRTGSAPLEVELGRFSGVSYEDRLCNICGLAVEDEKHVLIECPAYLGLRMELLDTDFWNLPISAEDKFVMLMCESNVQFSRHLAKLCRKMLNLRSRLLLL